MSDIKITSKLVEIPLEKLHVQYVPVVTPLEIWKNDMSLVNSPHVELLELIKQHGFDWKRIKRTRFYAVRKHRESVGMKQWTDDKIREHIIQRWKIYNSIFKKGFSTKRSAEKPVIVLREPFWTTRFGFAPDWLKGWEIWDGMRRSSACYVLGKKFVLGYFAEDTKPGSKDPGKFGDKLKNVKGVFDA